MRHPLFWGGVWKHYDQMDLIAKERDRLLQRTARIYGLSFTVVSFLCLSIPGAVETLSYFACIPLYIAIGICQWRVASSRVTSRGVV